ncbi:hypothetical protein A2291_03695 [candidate division WOR-1 bacterium RIFOXYB2_FULL_42_35]|uniref:Uncharacterized protein n=1 Tax=candidate division WOR-1 bacterium RIFOXYC2_FULL_41_25 TaxID=1802586 RepID=A0A1F4TQQ3_UNCSA|nr:MAG: hypothetical protein A2247_03265 [candidate division WOR-1 bacterium RIFOXYA2_FULL_41_14]OGC25566.1 MAG: hypothetical protein A2291_03695 [candidate division WOR-1 bacterium RIFOXYB2_FULL_42_35]OGC34998.1 MAG: hypothetical protein A2462_05325 [candidate division WOR-1 bacterium RIFOXYC2_FULL_41_25]
MGIAERVATRMVDYLYRQIVEKPALREINKGYRQYLASLKRTAGAGMENLKITEGRPRIHVADINRGPFMVSALREKSGDITEDLGTMSLGTMVTYLQWQISRNHPAVEKRGLSKEPMRELWSTYQFATKDIHGPVGMNSMPIRFKEEVVVLGESLRPSIGFDMGCAGKNYPPK